jgi:hypothetical protein
VNLQEQDARAWNELSWLRTGSSGVLGNEPSGSMKCGEFHKKNWGNISLSKTRVHGVSLVNQAVSYLVNQLVT